jgi:hypothetical protein
MFAEEAIRRQIELILTILELRGIAVDTASKSRIQSETRQSTLDRWAVAAREVERVAELFKTSRPRARRQ